MKPKQQKNNIEFLQGSIARVLQVSFWQKDIPLYINNQEYI